MNQLEFIEKSYISASLINAVVDQIGGWDAFVEEAIDVANHGASNGLSGFIYHEEIDAFMKKNHADVLALMSEIAIEVGDGESNTLMFFSKFKCLQGIDEIPLGRVLYSLDSAANDYNTIISGMGWFAAEEVCRDYQDCYAAITKIV